jgi:hypothetical protein
MLLRLACLAVLCGILVAGLWPFHAPRNNVQWLSEENGLQIGKYGSIVSTGEFSSRGQEANDSCSLEIWLAPKRTRASGSILAFYRPESHSSPFALRQSLADLTIESAYNGQPQTGGKAKVYIDDLFTRPRLVLLTITSNPAGTSVYADAALVKTFPKFRFSTQDLTGRIILGNSPFSTHEWSGELKGLAIYSRSMAPLEVTAHYKQWTSGDDANLSGDAVALYRFDERNGDVVHDSAQAATNLTIPSRFFILDEQFLQRPWKEFRNDGHYWKDVAVNIAGFVPLGLVFFACFSLAGRMKHPAAWTILLGFTVSLTIEIGQAFLPSRNSGMTDLITNTLGTAIGVFLFRLDFVHDLIASVGMFRRQAAVSDRGKEHLCEMAPAGISDSAR